MEAFMTETKAKCPKCNSINLLLTEVWGEHTIEWEQLDGKIDRNNGVLEPGDPYKVEGRCKDCGNNWTFRGVYQIDKLFKES